MMKRFISKISILIALVVVLAGCEVKRWEEVPVDYRTIYSVSYGQTLSSDQSDYGMEGVYKYHVYFDREPYALLTFSDNNKIISVSEIYDFEDYSGYPAGSTTYQYTFSFKEKVRTRQANGKITTSVRTFTVDGAESPNINNKLAKVVVTDSDSKVYGGEKVARVSTLTRPYGDGFQGYSDFSIDLME